ncbi:MAG: MBL fold metallo-hydrolase [Betaproteobacteria bacterium]|nr:MBL fold metallo-hydrolase [Betaproteobacteria bacterium]
MNITFLGAAGEVTGSCYLIECGKARFLIDCGMFQGDKDAWDKNVHALDFDASQIDFVLLTHAHIDHCGLLSRLCARGFRGPIYATPATADLMGVMLLDSAHVQLKDAERAQRHRREPAFEAEPLYSVVQAEQTLRHNRPVAYDVVFEPHAGIRACFRDAGHIIGSASIEIWLSEDGVEKKLVVSGDIGERNRPILRDPQRIEEADVLLVESTYGSRDHRSFDDTYREVTEVINRTLNEKRGSIVIPAFAVGRVQEVLYVLCKLARDGKIRASNGGMNIFVDSPMGARATELMLKHHAVLDEDVLDIFNVLAGRKGRRQHGNPEIRFTETPEESMALNRIDSGAIIISASGMCEAGRIRHHLRHRLAKSQNTVLFTGYQAIGTTGRRIVDGAKYVRLFGEDVAVRAEVATIGGLSAHAGQSGLLWWLQGFRKPPAQTFVVHGEPESAGALAGKIGEMGWSGVRVAGAGERVGF